MDVFDELSKYKYFDYYNTDKKYITTKIRKWYFYDDNEFITLMCNELVQNDKIQKKWYVKESRCCVNYVKINDVSEYKNQIESNLIKMNENYINNMKNISQINEIIGLHTSKSYNCILWNLDENSNKIKISLNFFLENEKETNIDVITKSDDKEVITKYNIKKLNTYLKKLMKNKQKNNDLNNKMENLNLNTPENTPENTEEKNNDKNFEIKPRREISNKYKNLFIKNKIHKRLKVQMGLY